MELRRTVQTLEIELQSLLAKVCTDRGRVLCFNTPIKSSANEFSFAKMLTTHINTEKGKLLPLLESVKPLIPALGKQG